MGQFRVKTGSCGNGRKNSSPISVNTETGSRKYRSERTKVKNRTGRNGNFSVRFQRYWSSDRSSWTVGRQMGGASRAGLTIKVRFRVVKFWGVTLNVL
jgi:hypothetical protein